MRCEQTSCIYNRNHTCTQPEDIYINYDRQCIKCRPAVGTFQFGRRENITYDELMQALELQPDPQMEKDKLRHLLLYFADQLLPQKPEDDPE